MGSLADDWQKVLSTQGLVKDVPNSTDEISFTVDQLQPVFVWKSKKSCRVRTSSAIAHLPQYVFTAKVNDDCSTNFFITIGKGAVQKFRALARKLCSYENIPWDARWSYFLKQHEQKLVFFYFILFVFGVTYI